MTTLTLCPNRVLNSTPRAALSHALSYLGNEVEAGPHSDSDVHPHLKRIFEEAISNGLPESHAAPLRRILDDYSEIFKVRLESDPLVAVPPMKILSVPGRCSCARQNTPAYTPTGLFSETENHRTGRTRTFS